MLLTLMKTLLALQSQFSPDGAYPADYAPNLKNGDEFDFIVVGGGSAGSVLVNRLSEVSDWKVLLLEAGGYPLEISEVPALTLRLQDSQADWQYKMEPSQTCCLSLVNHVCRCPRGKGLGGSSMINYLMYTRSTKYDHERWAEHGGHDWNHESLIKYYKKFENVHMNDSDTYGKNGELHITETRFHQPIRDILEEAYRELGYIKYTEDYPLGYRELLQTIYKGSRQNAAKAFLAPIKDRTNLHVALNAHVTKIILDPKTLVALGVEVRIRDQILQVYAQKEVILSAGAINSPQILMSSGVGHHDHLTKLGVKPIKDLPVGDNLQDHVAFPFLAFTLDSTAVWPVSTFQTVKEVYRYFSEQTGTLSNLDLTNFGSFVNTRNGSGFANIQFSQMTVPIRDPYFLDEYLRTLGAPEDVTESLKKANQNSAMLVLIPLVLHPKSSGRVRLSDTAAFSKPAIFPDLFTDSDGEDLRVLLEGIRLAYKIFETDAFAPYHPKPIELKIAKCQAHEAQSDDFWKCAIRHVSFPVFHPVGTCKMGQDASSVVDPELRVRGINKLRVADASVMPTIPSANTNAPSLMIGEKGADLVKKTWLALHDEL